MSNRHATSPNHRLCQSPRRNTAGQEAAAECASEGASLALESVFHAQYVRLCGYARKFVDCGDTAEDIVSDVLASAWERREIWPTRIRSYLHQSVRNRALNHLKGARVVRKIEVTMHVAGQVPGMAPPPATADKEVEARELAVAFEDAVDALPKRGREAYLLRRERGLSYAEAAEVMGTSARTVETHVARADYALRRRLEPLM